MGVIRGQSGRGEGGEGAVHARRKIQGWRDPTKSVRSCKSCVFETSSTSSSWRALQQREREREKERGARRGAAGGEMKGETNRENETKPGGNAINRADGRRRDSWSEQRACKARTDRALSEENLIWAVPRVTHPRGGNTLLLLLLLLHLILPLLISATRIQPRWIVPTILREDRFGLWINNAIEEPVECAVTIQILSSRRLYSCSVGLTNRDTRSFIIGSLTWFRPSSRNESIPR